MLSIYFGVPGSGKTTHAAMVVKKNLKKGITTYSNVDIKGAVLFDPSSLGVHDMTNGDLIIDEASICFNNRQYRYLPITTITWLKLYRHYGIRNVYVYSQSYEDMDVTLRRLADRLYVVRRSLIPFVHVVKPIHVTLTIDNDTHQIISGYRWAFWWQTRRFYAPAYWSMFNSWAAPALPDGTLHRVSCPLPQYADPKDLKAYAKTLRYIPFARLAGKVFGSRGFRKILHALSLAR